MPTNYDRCSIYTVYIISTAMKKLIRCISNPILGPAAAVLMRPGRPTCICDDDGLSD